MLKKLILLTAFVLSVFILPAQALLQDDGITMLVMPREEIPIQIGQDISRRYPVLLVSYQLVRGQLKIHAWNGDSWIFVPVEDYTNGTFFANRPQRAVIVEHAKFRAPDVMIPNSIWCESVRRLTSTDPRVILHLLGLSFDFPYRHWDQFAKRYGYELEEINPTLNNVHWWNLRADRLMEKRAKRDFAVDLDKWHYLEPLPPPPVEPAVMEEKEPAAVPAAPRKIESGATAVDITAKAPQTEPVKAPPVIPAAAPAPAPVKVPEIIPAPPAPAALPAAADPLPSLKPEPVIIPSVPEPAPIIEAEKAVTETVLPAAAEPAGKIDTDPFSADEIPAAEIVIPAEPAKPWWKLF